MRWILALWAAPMGLFWGWFYLSLNNVHFGWVMLTREAHDLIFQIYGEVLGIEAAAIPGMVAKACLLDTALLLAIWAFRRRREIAARLRLLRQRYSREEPSPST